MSCRVPLEYQRRTKRRLTVRPLLLSAALLCIAIGITGYVVFRHNFTFLAQDADKLPQSYFDEQDAKQPWMDFGCIMLPAGLLGFILLPFSVQYRRQ